MISLPGRVSRLFRRRDAAAAIGLLTAGLIVFQQPLRAFLDSVKDLEARYHGILAPAVIVAAAAFALQQYRRWRVARAKAEADAREIHERTEELERLVALSRDLSGALDWRSLRRALWENLLRCVHPDNMWLMVCEHGEWTTLFEDVLATDVQSPREREALADRTVEAFERDPGCSEGLRIDGVECFPIRVGRQVVGVLGLVRDAPLEPGERRTLSAATGLVAVAIRNAQLFREIRDASLRDGLTGCFNRTHAVQVLEAELKRGRRSGRPPSIIMFDLDHFKTINDDLGHLSGDRLLSDVGRRLHALLRDSDLRCRYGGDEFLLLLPDTPLAGAEHVAANLVKHLGLHAPTPDGSRPVTVSVGVAHAAPTDNVLSLIARADSALYDAKRLGRNRRCTAASPTAA